MIAQPRVLFVDDEPLVLRALERALRTRRPPWSAHYVDSGRGAIAALADDPYDIVVADLRIPDLDGAAILMHVAATYPHVARVVLSGQVGTDDCLRAVRIAHQCMAKPCHVDTLRQTIHRIAGSRALVPEAALATALTRVTCLPTAPARCEAVRATLARGGGLADVAHAIAGDLALTAKLVQIVNSAFFTQGAPVGTPERALTVLGADVVRHLLAGDDVLRPLEGPYDEDRLAAVQRHSTLVAQLARALAPRELGCAAYMTGLLHDVGELVAASLPPPLAELARPDRHARLGAYLLSLWGFPDAVVEAIAHHHDPGAVPAERAVLVDLIHLAELAATELAPAGHEVSGPSHAWLARNKGDAIPRAVEQARHLDRALPRAS